MDSNRWAASLPLWEKVLSLRMRRGKERLCTAMLEVVEEGGLGRRGEVEAVVEVVVLLPPDVGKGKESVAAEAVVHGRIGDGQPRWRVQDGIEELHGAVS